MRTVTRARGAEPSDPGSSLARRFWANVRSTGLFDGASHAVVGVSGGVDSMTLLHLLHRRADALGLRVHAVHVDHRMRAASGDDARWVERRCARWGVECHVRVARTPVGDEASGRRLRYAHFEEVRRRMGARALALTAHTADDQAETVLFRMARGSGPRGLVGVRSSRAPSVVRPLLPFRRGDVEAYAKARGVLFREDPTNRDERWTRNRIRRRILPELERAVPGAGAALAALAAAAGSESAALDELLDDRIRELALPDRSGREADAGGRVVALDREALLGLSDPVRAALLRRAAARVGATAGRGATAELLRFALGAPSGRRIDLDGGARAERALGAIVFRAARADEGVRSASSASSLRIDAPSGEGVVVTGGGAARVRWGPPPGEGLPFVADVGVLGVAFPLEARAWRPGDRIGLRYGSKKVKKVLLEARVAGGRRADVLVLREVGAVGGEVLWVPGFTPPAPRAQAAPGTPTCRVEVRYEGGRPS